MQNCQKEISFFLKKSQLEFQILSLANEWKKKPLEIFFDAEQAIEEK